MLLLAIQLTLTSPEMQCSNLRDQMQALEVAAQVISASPSEASSEYHSRSDTPSRSC
jgi:hypothetical protein